MSERIKVSEAVVAINGCYFGAVLPPEKPGDIRENLTYVVEQKATELATRIGREMTPQELDFCQGVVNLCFATMYLREGETRLEELQPHDPGAYPIRQVTIRVPTRQRQPEAATVNVIDGGNDD